MDNLSGRVVRGYELLELIGQGAFGQVYRAYHTAVEREVAIKIIRSEYANHPDFIRRFEAEAKIIAHLEHPYIVPFHDYWREPDSACLVMRYLRGGSLRKPMLKGPVSLGVASQILDQIAVALMVAHRSRVVHRDIKPENILLDEDGNAFLADFGIAKALKGNLEGEQHTAIGTPAYMSPEQFQGLPVSPQSDIFSLGIVMYEMLRGAHPDLTLQYLRDLSNTRSQVQLPPLDNRPDVPPAVLAILRRATAIEPASRYPDTTTMAAEFRQAVAGHDSLYAFDTIDLSTFVNPYKGLLAFAEGDAPNFFGRETWVENLLLWMKKTGEFNRFFALIGPSGSGKSSLIRAGLLPRLRQGALLGSDKWFVIECTPGAHPLEELEVALLRIAAKPQESLINQLRDGERGLLRAIRGLLPDDKSELLLVIDQFEEVFTLLDDEEERKLFLNSLRAAVEDPRSQVRVVVLLRADYIDQPLLYPEFGQLLNQRSEFLLPLNAVELESAIIEPAKRANLRLEGGLVSTIIEDVGQQPGTLPLLQYALSELVERRSEAVLTLASYREMGGVLGALARRADELYNDFDDIHKKTVFQMFMHLIIPGEGTPDMRRRVQQTELLSIGGDQPSMQRVVNDYGKYRLLTFDIDHETRVPTVEVAHEALIQSWDRLQAWLEESREDLRLSLWLTNAAEEWIKKSRHPGFLIVGLRLEEWEAWAEKGNFAPTLKQREFLVACFEERERRQRVEQERQQRELENAHQAAEAARQAAHAQQTAATRLRYLVVVLVIAFILALVLSIIAIDASLRANHTAQQRLAVQLAFQAQAELNAGRTDKAIGLALLASEIVDPPPPEVKNILIVAGYAPGTRQVFTGHKSPVMAMAVSADGKYIVSGGGRSSVKSPKDGHDNTIYLWDAVTGEKLREFVGHTDTVRNLAFSPDGKTFISASFDKTVRVWDVATGMEIAQLPGHTSEVYSVAINADGTMVAAGSRNSKLLVWDLQTGETVCDLVGHTNEIWGVDFSPNGIELVSSSGGEFGGVGDKDNSVRLWNLPTCTQVRRFRGHRDVVLDVDVSPDGKTILSSSADLTVRLWELNTDQQLHLFAGHTDWVTTVAFSPDGKRAISSGWDLRVFIWNVLTGDALLRFAGHTDAVRAVTFTPDGRGAVSAGDDLTLRLWDVESPLLGRHFGPGSNTTGRTVALSTDEQLIAASAQNGQVLITNAHSGQVVQRLEGHSQGIDPYNAAAVNAVTFSYDGSMVLSGGNDRKIFLWDVQTGSKLRAFEGHEGRIWQLIFTRDGTKFISASDDTTVRLWDTQSGQLIHTFQATREVFTISFTPEEEKIIAGTIDGKVLVWDVNTGNELLRFEGHPTTLWVLAVSPDGKYVVSGGYDTVLKLWDINTGEVKQDFRGHSSLIVGVSFSPDGRRLISASMDGTIRLWDTGTGLELGRIEYGLTPLSVVFNQQATRVLIDTFDDDSIRLFDLPIVDLDGVKSWIGENRYRPDECQLREDYQVVPLCNTPTASSTP